jgi:excisionase family DNA binding protein
LFALTNNFSEGIFMAMEKLLSTNEVAERLGVTIARVQALIWDERLPAMKIGRTYVIKESDLALVADRPVGRPKKEGAAEASPPAQTPATITPAQKRAIRDAQQQRWSNGAPGPKVSSQKSPAVKAKATKKGGKK